MPNPIVRWASRPSFGSTDRFEFVKFSDAALAAKLLATGDRPLVEGNTWRDTTWGCIQDKEGGWRGQNRLGISLMKVREELRHG